MKKGIDYNMTSDSKKRKKEKKKRIHTSSIAR